MAKRGFPHVVRSRDGGHDAHRILGHDCGWKAEKGARVESAVWLNCLCRGDIGGRDGPDCEYSPFRIPWGWEKGGNDTE